MGLTVHLVVSSNCIPRPHCDSDVVVRSVGLHLEVGPQDVVVGDPGRGAYVSFHRRMSVEQAGDGRLARWLGGAVSSRQVGEWGLDRWVEFVDSMRSSGLGASN